MPFQVFLNLQNHPKLQPFKFVLSAYNGTKIWVEGWCILHITHGITSLLVLLHVVDNDSPSILGLKTSKNLDLIRHIMKINSCAPDYLQQYSDCFGKIGCLKEKHCIVLDREVPSVINPPRCIPTSWIMKLNKELVRMVKMEIITPIEKPTDWVSSLVIVEKPNGQLWICLDPQNLNQAIKHPHFIMPTAEEILAQMLNTKFFTKLNASNAYWQIPNDDESSKLFTLNSPNVCYHFLHVPYDIPSASDVCQNRISQMLENIKGAENSQIDIIIWGETLEELKNRTIKVFKSIKKQGLKLNKKRCLFNKSEVFLGHRITCEGIFPDKWKVEAVTDMSYPINVKELQRLLGMVNYLGKFIPNLSNHTFNFWKLLEKDLLFFRDKYFETIDPKL